MRNSSIGRRGSVFLPVETSESSKRNLSNPLRMLFSLFALNKWYPLSILFISSPSDSRFFSNFEKLYLRDTKYY